MIISTLFRYTFTEELVQLMATYVLCLLIHQLLINHVISCIAPLQPFFVPPVASFLPSLAAYWSAKVPTGQLRFAHSDLVVWYEQEISTQPTMMQPGYKRGHPVLKTVFTIKENLL